MLNWYKSSILSAFRVSLEYLAHCLVVVPRWWRFCIIAGFILMSSHVSRQVMSFPEALITNRTLELVLPLPAVAFVSSLCLVVRPHVIHQVTGHPKADVAFGTDILGGH